jgi:hypothetical protein
VVPVNFSHLVRLRRRSSAHRVRAGCAGAGPRTRKAEPLSILLPTVLLLLILAR